MRDRHQAYEPEALTEAPHQAFSAPVISRVFSPADLDLDDLAEAIRLLLAQDASGETKVPYQPKSRLHFARTRVTHVMEADGRT